MDKQKLMYWLLFENSGEINDYLKYKLIERMEMEAAEEFVTDKDARDSVENDKIR